MTNRRLWLIDAAYLQVGASTLMLSRIDYKRLRAKLEEDGPIDIAHYVSATPPNDNGAQNEFYRWLGTPQPNGPDLIVKLHTMKKKEIVCPSCSAPIVRNVQRGVDIAIATLALTLVDRYDTLILSAGDGDFHDAVAHIRNTLGKRFELTGFRNNIAHDLVRLADHIYWLDDFYDSITQEARRSDNAPIARKAIESEPTGVTTAENAPIESISKEFQPRRQISGYLRSRRHDGRK